jgi:hypothetical protein
MAKTGISLAFHAYSRRDPVNGETKTFLRSAHSRQSSMRLKNFQKCVRQQMSGTTFRGGDPTANARSIRNAFSQAAKACSGGRS